MSGALAAIVLGMGDLKDVELSRMGDVHLWLHVRQLGERILRATTHTVRRITPPEQHCWRSALVAHPSQVQLLVVGWSRLVDTKQ